MKKAVKKAIIETYMDGNHKLYRHHNPFSEKLISLLNKDQIKSYEFNSVSISRPVKQLIENYKKLKAFCEGFFSYAVNCIPEYFFKTLEDGYRFRSFISDYKQFFIKTDNGLRIDLALILKDGRDLPPFD